MKNIEIYLFLTISKLYLRNSLGDEIPENIKTEFTAK